MSEQRQNKSQRPGIAAQEQKLRGAMAKFIRRRSPTKMCQPAAQIMGRRRVSHLHARTIVRAQMRPERHRHRQTYRQRAKCFPFHSTVGWTPFKLGLVLGLGLESAHAFERADTEKPAPISMGPNFFLDAGGQSESENEDESVHSHDSSGSERDSDQRSDSEQAEENCDDPPYPSDSDHVDSE
jgi:hypothetical protein